MNTINLLPSNVSGLKYSRFSLRYFLVFLALVFFIVVLYLVYNDIKERTIKEFNNEQIMLAKTASQGISSFFEDFEANLTFLAQLKPIRESSDESREILTQFYAIHKGAIEAITRVDANGNILSSFPENLSVVGKNISDQAHVKMILKTQKPVISDVFMSVQGYLAVAIHVPVFDNGVFKGSLALLIPIEHLGEKYLGSIKVRGGGSIFLLSENGIELFCKNPDHTGKYFKDNIHHNFDSSKLFDLVEKSAKSAKSDTDERIEVLENKRFNRQYVATHHAILENTYWTIIIRNNEKDINLSLTDLRNRLIVIFLFLSIAIAYYFYSIFKYINALKDDEKRKATEKTLRENEARFRTIFNESPVGIEFYNAKGEIINSNKASLKMFGIESIEKVRHFNLFDGLSLDTEKKEKLRKGEIINYQAEFDFDKITRLKLYETSRKGTAIFDYNITSLLNHIDDSVEGYLLQVQDVTDRIRAEEEITMLAQSLKSVNECVSITDLKDNIVFVNESFCNTYGYAKDELIGKHLEILRSPNNPSGLTEQILPSTIHSEWKGELLNKKKDGTEFPIYLSTTSIKDKDGAIIGLIGVASDITERKRKEEELIRAMEKAEESDRLKSAFLANMSHEIRTPMNGIIGFAELLSDTHFSGEEKREFIEIIRKSGQRMLNTVNDLIDISKIETGQMPIIYTEINVVEQITNLYRFFQHEAEEKGLSLILNNKIIRQTTSLKTDVAKLDSIVTNLIKNAIKYTDKGTVEIGIEIKDNNFELYVRDTGIGIPRHRQQAIFNRFEQADIGDTRAFQGSGLGLSITKAYTEMLGGKIHIESEEGKGSTFFCVLPLNSEKNQEEIHIAEEPVKPNKSKDSFKILVVEDDDIGFYYLQAILEEHKFQSIRCSNGLEAVEYCRENSDIDLILMDIRMPVMNGLEATRKIREFNTSVVIIAQTAFALIGDKETALAAGCNDYISKPINRTEFIKKVKQRLNLK